MIETTEIFIRHYLKEYHLNLYNDLDDRLLYNTYSEGIEILIKGVNYQIPYLALLVFIYQKTGMFKQYVNIND